MQIRTSSQRPPRQRQYPRNPHGPGDSRPQQESEHHAEIESAPGAKFGGRAVLCEEGEEVEGFVVIQK